MLLDNDRFSEDPDLERELIALFLTRKKNINFSYFCDAIYIDVDLKICSLTRR